MSAGYNALSGKNFIALRIREYSGVLLKESIWG